MNRSFERKCELRIQVQQLRELNAELFNTLRRAEAALCKDSRGMSLCSDTVEFHLDGETMYHAINDIRSAICRAERLK